jgi:AAA family ATP:ADP antiporter
MLDRFFHVRPNERRDAWSGFFVLFAFVGSFAMMETARDALFLASIDAARLPWVYLATAAASLVLVEARSRILAGRTHAHGRSALASALGFAALVTATFSVGLGSRAPAWLYALYVWSGVVSTLVLTSFWTLLGDVFSITQAKRLYRLVGAGSVLGAIAGSGAAGLVARTLAPRWLVLFAAAGFALSAAASLFLRATAPATPDARRASAGSDGLRASAALVRENPYARRVAVFMLVSACALTLADFIFKRAVVQAFPAEKLGSVFATIYFGLNVLSLLAQLGVVAFAMRRLGVLGSLAVLPLLLLLGGGLMLAVGGVVAAVVIKASDGALRHTLHRTSTELLFVPLPTAARCRVKAFIDVIGQRGGQVLASALVLTLVGAAAPTSVFAFALVVLCAAWLAVVAKLRPDYLDLFRGHLREGRLSRVEDRGGLGVGSLETLIAGLDSESDVAVTNALDLLEREGKAKLVPALILHHPSAVVVERALSLFARTGRKKVIHLVDRLLDHDAASVRSAAVTARSMLADDDERLEKRLASESSTAVRATIVVHLGVTRCRDLGHDLAAFVEGGDAEVHRAIALAIGLRRAEAGGDVLICLAQSPDPSVRLATIRAMGALEHPRFAPPLIRRLADEATRRDAETALVALGRPALDALGEALAEGVLEEEILWQLPKVIRRFEPQAAAATLQRAMATLESGMLRYRMIRALQQIVSRDPDVALDRARLEANAVETVARAVRLLEMRVALSRGAASDASRRTPGHELLVTLLLDKERHAIGRLFGLLALLHPREDFHTIQRGALAAPGPARASAVELLDHLLSDPLRRAVVHLVGDGPDEDRLRAVSPLHKQRAAGYGALLGQLRAMGSAALEDAAAFHERELSRRENQEVARAG